MSKPLFAVSALALFMAAAPFAAQAAMTAPECKVDASVDSRVSTALARVDRPADQLGKDDSRRSELNFVVSHVRPGDHVLDMGAGAGYASMILSAAVCNGQVDSQNPPQWVGGDKAKAMGKAMTDARPNLHLIVSDFTKVPAPAKPYDVIFIGTIYHDTYNMADHDAVAMDKNLLSMLKPGGLVILTDHKSAEGHGSTETNTLHRIEEATVLADFKAAGFEKVEDSLALANPADDHSLKVFDPTIRGKTDRMALVFRKPK